MKCQNCGTRPGLWLLAIWTLFLDFELYFSDTVLLRNCPKCDTQIDTTDTNVIIIPHFKTKTPISVPKPAVSDCQKWQIEVFLEAKIRHGLSGEEAVVYQMDTIEKRLKDKYNLNTEQCCSVYAFTIVANRATPCGDEDSPFYTEEECPFCGMPILEGMKTCEKDECIDKSIKLKL